MNRETCSISRLPSLAADLRREILDIYEEAEKALRDQGDACDACGACCRFSEWGHELWLTGAEFSLLVSEHGLRVPSGDGICPYLENGLCAARSGRALGCRVFTCKVSLRDVQDAMERYHGRLVEALRRHGADLSYGEILSSLADLVNRLGSCDPAAGVP